MPPDLLRGEMSGHLQFSVLFKNLHIYIYVQRSLTRYIDLREKMGQGVNNCEFKERYMDSIILFFQLFYKLEVFFKKVGGRKVAFLLKKKNLHRNVPGLGDLRHFS